MCSMCDSQPDETEPDRTPPTPEAQAKAIMTLTRYAMDPETADTELGRAVDIVLDILGFNALQMLQLGLERAEARTRMTRMARELDGLVVQLGGTAPPTLTFGRN